MRRRGIAIVILCVLTLLTVQQDKVTAVPLRQDESCNEVESIVLSPDAEITVSVPHGRYVYVGAEPTKASFISYTDIQIGGGDVSTFNYNSPYPLTSFWTDTSRTRLSGPPQGYDERSWVFRNEGEGDTTFYYKKCGSHPTPTPTVGDAACGCEENTYDISLRPSQNSRINVPVGYDACVGDLDAPNGAIIITNKQDLDTNEIIETFDPILMSDWHGSRNSLEGKDSGNFGIGYGITNTTDEAVYFRQQFCPREEITPTATITPTTTITPTEVCVAGTRFTYTWAGNTYQTWDFRPGIYTNDDGSEKYPAGTWRIESLPSSSHTPKWYVGGGGRKYINSTFSNGHSQGWIYDDVSKPADHPYDGDVIACFTGDYPHPTPTPTLTPTLTLTPTPTPTWDPQTPTLTPLPTITNTPEPTLSPTPTPAGDLSCISWDRYVVSTSGKDIAMTDGGEFRLSDYALIGSATDPFPGGVYNWNQASGTYTFKGLEKTIYVDVCISGAAAQTTATNTPIVWPTPIPTDTPQPTNTPDFGESTPPPDEPPGAPGGEGAPDDCVEAINPPTANLSPLPDLAIVVPTLQTLPDITATIEISSEVLIGSIQTMQAGVETPVADVLSATDRLDWQSGQDTAATMVAHVSPALDWLAILNPANAGYNHAGGALWALEPIIVPILPILSVSLIIVFVRFLLFMLNWFLKLIDLIVKLIELIPGE